MSENEQLQSIDRKVADIQEAIEKFGSLMETPAEERRISFMTQEYSDLHAANSKIHERMDKLGQNFLIAIGAIYALYFSTDSAAPTLVVAVPVFLAGTAAYLSWRFWTAARAVCQQAAEIEKVVYPRPANGGFAGSATHFLKESYMYQEEGRTWRSRRFWPADRVGMWVLFTILLAVGAYFELASGASPRIDGHDTAGTAFSCTEVLGVFYNCEKAE